MDHTDKHIYLVALRSLDLRSLDLSFGPLKMSYIMNDIKKIFKKAIMYLYIMYLYIKNIENIILNLFQTFNRT